MSKADSTSVCCFFSDALLVIAGWIAAYFIRFELLTPPEWLPLSRYLSFLPWVLAISILVFSFSGLYAPDRAQRLTRLVYSVARAVVFELIVVAASLSFYREFYFSRLHLILFGILTPLLMVSLRIALFAFLYRSRQLGKNMRRVLIVGAGNAGRHLANSFSQYPWMGLEVVGFLDDHKKEEDILGPVNEASAIVDKHAELGKPIDYVYLALPLSASDAIARLTEELSKRLTHVCLVPDLFQFNMLHSRVTEVDGLPVLHLLDEAPIELRRFLKRTIDVVLSAAVLVFLSPLFLLISIGVKLSSKGPIFYRQERMSLNGQRFDILKFRTMPTSAEASSGPVWAKAGENRATSLGRFLRRTSLDELPQFLNVLRGDMSVVGPRPERPVFIENFRQQVPGLYAPAQS